MSIWLYGVIDVQVKNCITEKHDVILLTFLNCLITGVKICLNKVEF